MRWPIAIVVLVSACFNPQYGRPACGANDSCPSGRSCVAGFCERPGPDTEVGETDAATIDVPSNAATDGSVCFGSGLVIVCLDSMPDGPLTLGGAAQPVNTDAACPVVVPQSGGGPALCVYAGTTITIVALLLATGTRPLVLVASDEITVPNGGTIDVSSTSASAVAARRRGAGATGTPCNAAIVGANDSGGGGGGAGGSFGTSGGAGGEGDTNGNGDPSVPATGGTPAAPTVAPPFLRGGCSGGAGGEGDISGGAHPGGLGGDGGGAVALIAGRSISIAGNVFASGAGGGTNPPPDNGAEQGGGGGGPGGMILLDAPQIIVQGRAVANGGAGGGGGGVGTSPNGQDRGGSAGEDGTTTMWDKRAKGGIGAGTGTGKGADGTTQGVLSGLEGESASGGGGGGAGGLGLIWTYGSLQRGSQMSPSPIVH